MRFLIILPLVFVSFVTAVTVGGGECYYCYEACGPDTMTSDTFGFANRFKADTGCASGKMGIIRDEIENSIDNLNKLHNITTKKLESYAALRNLKQEELNELNKINSLLEKLIEQENTRIKLLKIKAKDEVNIYE